MPATRVSLSPAVIAAELSNEKIMMRPKELQSSKPSIEDFR
jgi:hypothetical protein